MSKSFHSALIESIQGRGGSTEFIESIFESDRSSWGKDNFDADAVDKELKDADDEKALHDSDVRYIAKNKTEYKAVKKYNVNSSSQAQDAIVAAMIFMFSRYDLSSKSGTESSSFIDKISNAIAQGIEEGLHQSKHAKYSDDDEASVSISRKLKSIYSRLVYNFNKKKSNA